MVSKQKDALPLFDAVEKRRFGPRICFLCGCSLGVENRSEEHVIPKWLQKRFKLLDQRLVLLNGTSIPYKQLTIPCCKPCNNKHLAPIENKVKLATSRNASAV